MSLDWRGDAVRAKVLRAAAAAIDETTEDTARSARASHWWRARRSHGLESQIVTELAEVDGTRARGAVGATSRRGFYALFHERKTPFLRPAADSEFPRLADRIKERLR